MRVNMEDLSKTSQTPIIDYCNDLIRSREGPETPLEVFRTQPNGDTILAIKCTSIGAASKLRVTTNNRGTPVFKVKKI